ncbi:hypothetical protein QO015_001175 [Kaistia geumhonensis]|jgi:hypothetical protein|uniref:Uncharacterized protein n=1 Tax=Kaistia geumhonensis TaxID=410839 RepID=A0ABU0M3N6_9HYPH|nr:hypothetical protein [Kaistia geumhonensis]
MATLFKRLMKREHDDHRQVFRDFAGVLERLVRRR